MKSVQGPFTFRIEINDAFRLDSQNIPVVLDIIKHVSELPVRGKSVPIAVTTTEPSAATLREAFTLLSTIPPEVLRESQANLSSSPIASIRHLLTSRDPNDQYLFVSCLSCLDPSAWAGTVQGTTPVLDQWEVQEVMKLLDSRDGLIRKMVIALPIDVRIWTDNHIAIRRSRFSTLSIQLSWRPISHGPYKASRTRPI
jgi:hypothetical protein